MLKRAEKAVGTIGTALFHQARKPGQPFVIAVFIVTKKMLLIFFVPLRDDEKQRRAAFMHLHQIAVYHHQRINNRPDRRMYIGGQLSASLAWHYCKLVESMMPNEQTIQDTLEAAKTNIER